MVTFVKEFENYILSDKREESLISIIPGSEADIYLQISKALNEMEEKRKVPENLEGLLNKIKMLNSEAYNQLNFKILLKSYDLPEATQESKENVLAELKKIVCPNAKFNYTRPTNSKINLSESSVNSKFPSELDQNLIQTPEKTLEKFYREQSNFSLLSSIESTNLPKLIDYDKLNINEFFRNVIIYDNIPFPVLDNDKAILERVVKFLDQESENNRCFPFIDRFLITLPVELLQLLSDAITSEYCDKNRILNMIINKTYQHELSQAESNPEKREILLKIYDKIKNYQSKYQAYKSNILLELLNLNILLNKFDLELFIEYIKNPIQGNYSVFKHSQEKFEKLNTQQRYNLSNWFMTNSDSQIISDHLNYFFLHENKEVKTFDEYLETNLVKKAYFNALVLKGVENEEVIKYLGQSAFEKLINKTEITICKHNKERFAVDEDVELDLDIKNIQTLFIKIFEINTENYYYNQKTAFDTSISLEGLVACSDETFIYNEKPQIKKRKNFKFSSIPKKRGLYVVEFIGGGYSSRAIIKKGNLSIINRETSLGNTIYILNEKSEICKPSKPANNNEENTESASEENHNTTGVWFKGNFYPANDKGLIIIPHGKTIENDICIINHDGFSEIGKLQIQQEYYDLKGAFYVNHESLMMGNTAKFIFRGLLTLNDREVSLTNLKKATLTALISKTVNGEVIPTSQVFDKITLDKNKEFSFDLQIPPKLTSILLVFEAEVFNKSKQENDKVCYSYDYKNYETEENFIKMFIKKTDDLYYLFVLGKNGEPKSDVVVNIALNTKQINKIQDPIKLQTDLEGKITLGQLKDVVGITASLVNEEYSNIAQKWNIAADKKFLYPWKIDALENEKITLPVQYTNLEESNVVLLKMTDDQVISNQKANLTLIPVNEEKTRFNLEINNLEKGHYILNLDQYNNVTIDVHKGKYWDTDDYIITFDKIIENKAAKNILSIKNLQVDEEKDELNLTLQNADENTRVHVYAYSFLNQTDLSFFDDIKNIYTAKDSRSTQSVTKWTNYYLDNRKLNDEIQYVLDRKNLERQMGNSLEKPSLLIKRKFIRDTVTEKEVLEAGTKYEKKDIRMFDQKQMDFMEKTQPCGFNFNNNNNAMYLQQNQCFETNMYSNASYSNVAVCTPNYQNSILNFSNFLKESANLLINTGVTNDSEKVNITNINLKKYSHLQIFCLNGNTCYEEFFSLKGKKVETRDLTLKESLESDKSYAELRISECFSDKSTLKIDDITSTSFKIIDSLEKVVNFKILLNKSLSEKWNEFRFLLNFDELNDEDKKNKITKYFSYELNLFLYFKYPEIFNKYILPLLKFKAEKGFLDFFMMNDKENIDKFISPRRIDEMNVLEKCILILSIRNSLPELAKEISNSLESETENIKNESEIKKYFDILMNMKNEGDEKLTETLMECDAEDAFSARADNLFGGAVMHQEAMIPRACAMPAARAMNASIRLLSDQPQVMKKCSVIQKSMRMEKRKRGGNIDEDEDIMNEIEEENLRDATIRKNFDINAGKSKEYCETHYLYGNLVNNNSIPISKFWSDLACYWANTEIKENYLSDFLSKNIILNSTNITDLIFTLAVLSLPAKTKNHQFSREGAMGIKIEAASNLILFTKRIKESNANFDSNLMIAQSVYLGNFSSSFNSENKNVNEFLPNKIYCHKTNVINLSPKKINFDILIQIPQGAIPVKNSDYIKTINQNLDNNICEFLTYFYFPSTGEFTQYPPTASREGVIISKGKDMKYDVKEKQSHISSESLDDVLEIGSKEDILGFFKRQKLIKKKDLEKIYWIMIEKNFFVEITSILRKKGIYDDKIWQMGFLHNEELTIKEFMENKNKYKIYVGNNFNSTLLTVDESNDQDVFNHLDYHPLLNARVHKVGQSNKLSILNREFRTTYQNFIISLISKKEITCKDYLRLSYYLILQDRIEEASRIFKKINVYELSKYLSWEIQYDYISAYLDFSIGYPDFTFSRSICKKYKDFPLEQ